LIFFTKFGFNLHFLMLFLPEAQFLKLKRGFQILLDGPKFDVDFNFD